MKRNFTAACLMLGLALLGARPGFAEGTEPDEARDLDKTLSPAGAHGLG